MKDPTDGIRDGTVDGAAGPPDFIEPVYGDEAMPGPVAVDVPGAPYEVYVGPGARHDVGTMVNASTQAQRVLVVTQEPVARHWGDDVVRSLAGAAYDVDVVTVRDGEAAKSPEVLGDLWTRCGRLGLQRRDAIVALGCRVWRA